jgi:hypothetical protein
MIVKTFADGGFGAPQQLAGLANAIAESGLNPDAVSEVEQAVGLFQLNRGHGLGGTHSIAELKDPALNIKIILSEAAKVGAFRDATSLEDAVSTFVRFIIRPANPAAEIARRLKIAEQLQPDRGLIGSTARTTPSMAEVVAYRGEAAAPRLLPHHLVNRILDIR